MTNSRPSEHKINPQCVVAMYLCVLAQADSFDSKLLSRDVTLIYVTRADSI
jgi:hypothetical protein